MLLHQMCAPNSPQWFNTGLNFAYGITGPAQGHFYCDPKTGEMLKSRDAYTHPQPHACQPYFAPVSTPQGRDPDRQDRRGEPGRPGGVTTARDDGRGTTRVVAVKANGEKVVLRVSRSRTAPPSKPPATTSSTCRSRQGLVAAGGSASTRCDAAMSSSASSAIERRRGRGQPRPAHVGRRRPARQTAAAQPCRVRTLEPAGRRSSGVDRRSARRAGLRHPDRVRASTCPTTSSSTTASSRPSATTW